MTTTTRRIALAALAATLCTGASCGGNDTPTQPTPSCSIAISPGTQSFGSEGGTASVTVTAAAGCAWNVTAGAAWITITSGDAGSGPGTVTYSVPANPAAESRSGTLTIGGQAHAVTQQGRPPAICSYQLSPTRTEVGKDGGAGSFAVGAPDECAWTAASNAPWLTVRTGNQGSGNGTVTYTVAANMDVASRTGLITVADRVFTVEQSGDLSVCRYSVEPVEFRPCMPAGNVTATVTTTANCPWTATANVSWLTVPAGSSGSGSGTIAIAFPDNYDTPRDGLVMVRWPAPTAGQNIRVAQAGCFYAVSRSTFDFAAAGGSGAFDLLQQSEPQTCGGATQDRCVWSPRADVSWITISGAATRSGDDRVSFTVAPNPDASSRVGRISIRDKVVIVTQGGR